MEGITGFVRVLISNGELSDYLNAGCDDSLIGYSTIDVEADLGH